MRKVLFICYTFPPLLSPESIQSSRYTKYLLRYEWKSYVISVDEKCTNCLVDYSMTKMVPANILVVRTKSIQPGFLMSQASKLFPGLLKMPDSTISRYLFASSKAIQMSKTNKFNLIHSWSGGASLTNHLVGLKFKKRTKLPWVVHLSDPWVDNSYRKYGRIDGYVNRRMEKAVVENANAIIFVSEETRQLVMKKYPSEMMSKTFVIPHCYDEELRNNFKKQENSKFTIAYTGSFYGNRTPIPLFRAIQNILKKQPNIDKLFTIQLVGNLSKNYKNMISEFGIGKIVSHVGVVPYFESLKYISNADVLLLIDAPSVGPSVFLPLKLIEYVGSGNPIFGITPLEGASANLIRKLGGIVVSPDDIDGIEKSILTLCEKYKSNCLPNHYEDEHLANSYSAQNSTRILAEIFNRYVL